MEFNNSNDNNGNGGEEQQQQQKSARKRKLDELANGKPAAGEEDQPGSSKKNREEGNGLDLELESFSREELIKMVRKQMGMTMEAQKQMEAAKKEAEEKKPGIDNCQEEGENTSNPNDSELPKSLEGNEESTNLSSSRRHRKLPPELNCQIFYCFNLATRHKFIYGLGWDFYAMFRQSLLKKSKRIRNPERNTWRSNGLVTISENGLSANNNTYGRQHICAEKGFPISRQYSREDNFPGTILYYYEIKILKSARWCDVGLTDGKIPYSGRIGIGWSSNSYSIDILIPSRNIYQFHLAGQSHEFQFPERVIRPELKTTGNVIGCGILMDPDDKLTIFFTFNGILIGHQFPIESTVDYLIPTVTLWDQMFVEANFGDNPAKPFEYDIKKMPRNGIGMDLRRISGI